MIKCILIVAIVGVHLSGCAQDARFNSSQAIDRFYKIYGQKYAWVGKEHLQQALSFLKNAPYLGLKAVDYDVDFVDSVMANKYLLRDEKDSTLTDKRITDVVLLFFNDVAMGSTPPGLGYNGLDYRPGCIDNPSLLAAALSGGTFAGFLEKIEPPFPEYIAVKTKLAQFISAMLDPGFIQDVVVNSRTMDSTNRSLIRRLQQLSFVDKEDKLFRPGELKEDIKQAQRLFSFFADGSVGPMLLKELNTPLSVRVAELSAALNTIRWLRCARMQYPHIIFVNIPSAFLFVYDTSGIALTTEVIVGKKTTRTPVFTSRITEVILYPYWTVPAKMATQELLPLIKKNPGYLEANNFQVLNKEGRIVDIKNIEWGKLTSSNFPYTLRQSTGCDNSLGIVKLNFYSPYGVYLHDTPWKSLFYLTKRYFSHGCMRVNKAMELARLLLKDNTAVIDTLEEKGCLLDQRPIVLPASERMPVFVLYNTAWVDGNATVHFYEDVYGKRSGYQK